MNRLQQCLLFTGFLISLSTTIFSQICHTTPSAQMDFAVNAVTTKLLTGGDLWWNGNDARHQVINPANTSDAAAVRTLFVGGLWLSAIDAAGQLRYRAQQHGRGTNNFDYAPGPLLADGTGDPDCENWDRFFPITREQIDTMVLLAQMGTPLDFTQIPENVLSWPGAGNPYFSQVNGFDLRDTPQGYAPFLDQNEDGIYNPIDGDYPLFLGDAAVWLVFSSAERARESGSTSSLPLEIQLLVYGWKAESGIINQSTFYQYRIISRAQEILFDFRAGHFTDHNLGCPSNEYFGSNPSQDLFFGYNKNAIEPETCESQNYASNLDNTPISLFQLVDTPHRQIGSTEPIMESFSFRGAFIENPESASFVSQGLWQDSVLLTRGGTGYNPGTNREPTKFMFDGGEVDGLPWHMCTEELAPVNLVTKYTTTPRQLNPGSVTGFTLAQSTLFSVSYDEECPDLEAIYAEANFLRQYYYNEKQAAGIISSTKPQQTSTSLKVYPNPANDQINFSLPNGLTVVRISIFDQYGRKVLHKKPQLSTFSLALNRVQLSAGTYFYRLQTINEEVLMGKLIIR